MNECVYCREPGALVLTADGWAHLSCAMHPHHMQPEKEPQPCLPTL